MRRVRVRPLAIGPAEVLGVWRFDPNHDQFVYASAAWDANTTEWPWMDRYGDPWQAGAQATNSYTEAVVMLANGQFGVIRTGCMEPALRALGLREVE